MTPRVDACIHKRKGSPDLAARRSSDEKLTTKKREGAFCGSPFFVRKVKLIGLFKMRMNDVFMDFSGS